MKKTLVIIPTYNEIENIESIIHEIFKIKLDLNILVVDDNSPDGTGDVVYNLIYRYSEKLFLKKRKQKEGLGAAYVEGFLWAINHNYDFIFEMDADFSHNPSELLPMLELLNSNVDVVVGSRYIKGFRVVNWPLTRILISYLSSLYVRLITLMPIKDPTAGFVGYKREVLINLNLKQIKFIGYAFQIEMKYKSWLKGFIIKEHPIVFLNRKLGKSKMDKSIIWEAFKGVLFLRLNKKMFLKKNEKA